MEKASSRYRPWHRQEWIIFDRDGRVHGRARGFVSDQLSALIPLLYPKLEGLYSFRRAHDLAVPVRDRKLAEYFPCIDFPECEKRGLGDLVRHMRREMMARRQPVVEHSRNVLQEHFERTEATL